MQSFSAETRTLQHSRKLLCKEKFSLTDITCFNLDQICLPPIRDFARTIKIENNPGDIGYFQF